MTTTRVVKAPFLDRLLHELEHEIDTAAELRRHLHQLAEPSHEEHATARALRDALGRRKVLDVGGAGFAARLGDPHRDGVVVRAELDALPVVEATGAPFASTNGHMHACGHDVHMAALTAVFRSVQALEPELPAPLIALFQPSEEAYPSGARQVTEHAEKLGRVGAVVAAHVHPDVPWLEVAADAGSVNAYADNFSVSVVGLGGHAAYPHQARDAVVALSHIVVALQQVVSRRIDPVRGAALTVSMLRAGTAENVIAGSAEARGTLRALEGETRAELRTLIPEVAGHVARGLGCDAKVTFVDGEPGVVNDPVLAAEVRSALGAAGFARAAALRSCGSDDFGYYRDMAPSLLAFVGLKDGPGWKPASLHHECFLPPPDAVRAVARAQAASYVGAAATLS